jgi:hypothetical protein
MFFLNTLRGVAIEFEHGGIELQDILVPMSAGVAVSVPTISLK